MKKNTLSLIPGMLLLGILFASCSSMRQNTAFNERKYYNFRHHDPVVVLNTPKQAHTKETVLPLPIKQASVASAIPTKPKAVAVPAADLNAAHKNIDKRAISHIAAKQSSARSNEQSAPFYNLEGPAVYMPQPATEMSPAETTGGGGSGVSQVVIIILAIFLSPLGVYLYDNAATTRFWIDLLLWVVGIGFFGVIIFLGILWLVAVIYALLIVTGSI